ncbi:MAG: glycosyltransferase family 4 protein [Omnitrophica bacterium]|nr:glycosyltransferase family 4 protein [Candidatus Omnitrophota bacterium]
MKIGIDARIILYQRRGGAHYIYKLLESLFAIEQDNKYRILFSYFRGADKSVIDHFKRSNVKTKALRVPNRILTTCWEKFSFPSIELLLGKLDVFHIPYCHHFIPTSTELIVTIHDLIPLRFPQHFSKRSLDGYTRMHRKVLKKAKLIITDSQNSKNDIVELMGIDEKKIKVIMLGVDERFKQTGDKEKVSRYLSKYNINSKYILFVGGPSENKNVSGLLKGYKIFRENSSQNHKLVLVGKKSWGYSKIIEEAKDLGLERDIIVTGYVSDEDLVYIYNGADLLVHPSLYEGFGFPPLEAMACGVPVVASDVSSIPEVVGDAAILIDPYNTEDLAQVIIKVIDDSSLRQELTKKGLQRAKDFSWERCARETLAVYQQAANS